MKSKTSTGWWYRAGTVEVQNHLNLLQLGQLLLCHRDAVLHSGLTALQDLQINVPNFRIALLFLEEKKKKRERENAMNFNVKYDLEEENTKKQVLTSWKICYTPATLLIRFYTSVLQKWYMGYMSIRKLGMNQKYNQYVPVISKSDIISQSALYALLAVYVYVISHTTKFLGLPLCMHKYCIAVAVRCILCYELWIYLFLNQ